MGKNLIEDKNGPALIDAKDQIDYWATELYVLRKLARQMRMNVETRSRSPKWLENTLNEVAKAQDIESFTPGIRYGSQPKYE